MNVTRATALVSGTFTLGAESGGTWPAESAVDRDTFVNALWTRWGHARLPTRGEGAEVEEGGGRILLTWPSTVLETENGRPVTRSGDRFHYVLAESTTGLVLSMDWQGVASERPTLERKVPGTNAVARIP